MKMKKYKKLLSAVLVVFMLLSLNVPAMAANKNIVIIYTNDIHTYIANHLGEGNENGLTYSKIVGLKELFENVILVDAGDHIQGTAYGSMDNGATMIELMNAAGYDIAVPGNHEFDYGMERYLELVDSADFQYICSNFYHESEGVRKENVLESYTIVEMAGKKIAFVGMITPEAMVSSTPAYFQDDEGNYIYNISGVEDSDALYADVQNAIDEALAAGADYIIGVGHLGIDPSSVSWTSRDVIANTMGLDALIDGHSHSTVEMEYVTDKS